MWLVVCPLLHRCGEGIQEAPGRPRPELLEWRVSPLLEHPRQLPRTYDAPLEGAEDEGIGPILAEFRLAQPLDAAGLLLAKRFERADRLEDAPAEVALAV